MRPLAVFIVFFGELPPWLPLTLQSMAYNANVSFVVIGDAAAPAVLPPNVRFEQITFAAMQARLGAHITGGLNRSAVSYSFHYKANDIKPLAAELYPELAAGHEWWAWADLDVIFGDLLRFLRQASTRPACCKVPLKLKGPHKGEPRSVSAVNVYTHKVRCVSARESLPRRKKRRAATGGGTARTARGRGGGDSGGISARAGRGRAAGARWPPSGVCASTLPLCRRRRARASAPTASRSTWCARSTPTRGAKRCDAVPAPACSHGPGTGRPSAREFARRCGRHLACAGQWRRGLARTRALPSSRLQAWGPFTAFRMNALLRTADSADSASLRATGLYRNSPQWRAVISSGDYAHFVPPRESRAARGSSQHPPAATGSPP
eukprot:496420-Prymnesium_polylepis.1